MMQATGEHVVDEPRDREREAHTGREADEMLARRAVAGDPDAFEALVERYRDRLYRFALRLMPNPSDAEEVVQDALLNAYRGLPSFRADAKFGTWLHQIVINGALAQRRRSRRRPLTTPLDDHLPRGEDAPRSGPGDRATTAPADELLQRKQLIARIHDALDRLDDHHRAVLVLRDLEGLSSEEVAEIFAIQVPAVRQRLHRARLQLRSLLADVAATA